MKGVVHEVVVCGSPASGAMAAATSHPSMNEGSKSTGRGSLVTKDPTINSYPVPVCKAGLRDTYYSGGMKMNMTKPKLLIFMWLVLVSGALTWGIGHVDAAPCPAGLSTSLDARYNGYCVPDYYTTPNWANSPPLTKFVNTLPGLGAANANNILQLDGVGQFISVAVPDVVTYPGSDYYELELREFTEIMHSDMPNGTRLRGYVQVNNGTDTTSCTPPVPGAPAATDCTTANLTIAPAPIRYLGPTIVAQKNRPVRVKFTNALPANSSLFLPVDNTIMGAGSYSVNYDPATKLPTGLTGGLFSQNRATLHLHGGRSPWISDGTTHQWITPAGENQFYGKGMSVAYVPDMWFDTNGNTIPACAGLTTCAVEGASNNPGPGMQTFYWTNAQSSRLMFYHDHAYGITRLNVYAGEAAGYLLKDPVETALIEGGTINGRTFDPLTIPGLGIPLIIQDKTFVNAATIGITDPTWAWGTSAAKPVADAFNTGDLWWPHVYMPAENPYSPDFTGMNAFGRWVYSPWFFPPVPVCGTGTPPAVKPWCIDFGAIPNPYCLTAATCQPGQSPIIPGTPHPSTGAEAFMDTMLVNGTAYPTTTLPAGKYRLRILNASHDRFLNLQWYQATSIISGFTGLPSGSGYASAPVVTITDPTGTGATATAAIGTGAITAIAVASPGSGYTAPVVDITDPTGTGATATAAVGGTGAITAIAVTSPGSLYTAPIVDITDPTGTGATASASIDAFGAITGFTVTAPGTGYTAPVVTITDPTGTGATASATIDTIGVITGFTVTAPGTGYTAPVVTITDPTGTGATATAASNSGMVTAIDIITVGSGYTAPVVTIAAPSAGGTQATATATVYAALTEVGMVPAVDSREGGVPDPARKGPAWIQIANEGGFLPKPVVLPNQPVMWNTDPTMFNVGNVLQQNQGGGTLFLAPAERADVIVDFTNYGGKTLILYNDAPTAFPALVGQYDYFTGAPDRTDSGGYGPIPPGFGPNIRTVMQVVVTGAAGTPTGDDYDPGYLTLLEEAFASNATGPGAFQASQEDIIVGQGLFTDTQGQTYGTDAYNKAYATTFSTAPQNWGVYTNFSDYTLTFQTFDLVNGVKTIVDKTLPLTMKAMHDEMGGTFDDYGRMSAKLGLENPAANAANANFIMQQFVDPPTEIAQPGEVQIWRINHNGVDTHPIHFHLFEVQLINRIGWDGFVRLPDPNELGWKDTVRISPLEDTLVALRPILPYAPFRDKIPNSFRPLNPTIPLGSELWFSQQDLTNGGPLVPPMTNQLVNFGDEYTWHCHILSHEENDMMRPIAFAVAPAAPGTPTVTVKGSSATITWLDNSANETGFIIEKSTNGGPFVAIATVPGSANGVTGGLMSYTDKIKNKDTNAYQVTAINVVGLGASTYPSVTATSLPVGASPAAVMMKVK